MYKFSIILLIVLVACTDFHVSFFVSLYFVLHCELILFNVFFMEYSAIVQRCYYYLLYCIDKCNLIYYTLLINVIFLSVHTVQNTVE